MRVIPDDTVEAVSKWATDHGVSLSGKTVRGLLQAAVDEGGLATTTTTTMEDGRRLTAQQIGTRVEVVVKDSDKFMTRHGADDSKRFWAYTDPLAALADAKVLGNAAAAAIKYRAPDPVDMLVKKWIRSTGTVDTTRTTELEQIFWPIAREILKLDSKP
jgi:hypothetical protein